MFSIKWFKKDDWRYVDPNKSWDIIGPRIISGITRYLTIDSAQKQVAIFSRYWRDNSYFIVSVG